jgi:hypothetical protein
MNRLLKKIRRAAGQNRGSTIVGVLAALVFISLVTSLMVKNTGAQTASSMGYGTAMTMQSTVMSGIMATEAVFDKDAASVVNVLDAINNDKQSRFVPGLVSGNNRLSLGNGQFFSSKVLNFFNGAKKKATVEINSGTKAGGKGLKKALTFIKVENLSDIPPEATYKDSTYPVCEGLPPPIIPSTGSENAVYMAGSLRDGNNGMEVVGGATFEDEVRFQNKKAVFYGEAFFQKDVYFLADAGYVFYGNTYFNANVTIQNQPNPCQLFRDTAFDGTRVYPKVGVNNNLTAFSRIHIPGNFYIKGTFGSDNTIIKQNAISGNPPTKEAHISNNITTAQQGKIENYTIKSDLNATSDIPKLMNMKSLAERTETQFISYDEMLTKIKAKVGNPIRSSNTVKGPLSTGGEGLNLGKLENAYRDDSIAGKLYEGHLVVLINFPNKYEEFKTHGLNGTTFTKKVIFLLESGKLASNGSFYCSSPTSSTLIYVGKNGQLQDFGSNCLFRGYIYIDKENTSGENGFYWGDGSSIEGAFHNFSTFPFKWNFLGNNVNQPTKITYNAAVLAPFNTLKRGYTAGNNTTVTPPSGSYVKDGYICKDETIKIKLPPAAGSHNGVGLEDPIDNSLNPRTMGYYFY